MRLKGSQYWIVGVLAVSLCISGESARSQQEDPFSQRPDLFGGGGADEADAATDTTGPDGAGLSPQDQLKAFYDQGTQLFAQGDFNAAIKQFSEALKLNPRDFPSLYELGRAFVELGDFESALQSFSQAAIYGRSFSEPFFERGKVYMELGRHREAAEDFRMARQLDPGNPEHEFQNGLALAEIGYNSVLGTAARESLDEAVRFFDRAIDLNPTYAEAFFERGSALLRLGELDDSIDDLEKANELDAENSEWIAQLGFARLQRASNEAGKRNGDAQRITSDYQAAIVALGKFFQIAPPPPDKDGKTDEEDKSAKEDKDEILHENVHVARAVAYIGLADETGTDATLYEKAIEDCDEAIELNPDLGNAYNQRGIAQRMMGDLDAAIDSFTEAIEINPSNTDAVLRRGIAWFRKQDYDLALTDFAEARAYSTSSDPRVSFWAGLTQAMRGDYRAAIDNYSLALKNRPDFISAYMNRAIAYMKVGRNKRAISDLNQILRREPDNEKARNYRALAYRLTDG